MRKIFPQKTKTDHYTGANQPYHPCCAGEVGSPGCTTVDNHVFKVTNPARLAAVLQFINTPENCNPSKDRDGNNVAGITFDCEMGYTVFGLELIRMTVVSWPAGSPLVDVLVRPLGTVLDLNTRFSGVSPDQLANAEPFNEAQPFTDTLRIVPNPQAARTLLLSYVKPSTPVIGHAIDNDLNVIRLCHPTIIDTILLYPHPRGLPFRLGLKALSARILKRNIQIGGAAGHDSLEDARATGDLVRAKVGEKWKLLRYKGWSIRDDKLCPPEGSDASTQQAIDELVVQVLGSAPTGAAAGKKRKHDEASLSEGISLADYLKRSQEGVKLAESTTSE